MLDDIKGLRRLQRELNKSFERMWKNKNNRNFLNGQRKNGLSLRSPLTDLEETDKEIIIKFEIPGVDKKDIQLNATEDKVEVKVEKKQENKVEEKGFYRKERRYSGFYRVISLPAYIIPEKAKATYKDGILEFSAPKAEAKKKNKIEVE